MADKDWISRKALLDRIEEFLMENSLAYSVGLGVSIALFVLLVVLTIAMGVLIFTHSLWWLIGVIFGFTLCGVTGGIVIWLLGI